MDLLTSGYQCFKNAFLLPYFYFHPMLADNAEKRYSKKWRDLLHTTTKARKRNESTISKMLRKSTEYPYFIILQCFYRSSLYIFNKKNTYFTL